MSKRKTQRRREKLRKKKAHISRSGKIHLQKKAVTLLDEGVGTHGSIVMQASVPDNLTKQLNQAELLRESSL